MTRNNKQKPSRISWGDLLIVVAIIVVFAWVLSTASGGDDVSYHHARSAIAIAHGLTENAPDSDTCPACDGRGEVGDGRTVIRCEECDGTGKKQTGDFIEIEFQPVIEAETVEPPGEPEPLIELPPSPPVVVEWSTEEAPTAGPRLPRVLMLTSDACSPCRRVKAESGDLIGDASAAIEAVDVLENSSYPSGYGIRAAPSIPTFVVLNEDGGEVSRLTGYQSRGTLEWLLQRHQVNQAITTSEPGVTATIHAEPTVAAGLEALALHLGRQEDAAAVPVGGLFDRDVKTPVIVPELLRQLMAGDVVNIEDAGIQISWIGDRRSIVLEDTEHVVFKPPATVKLTKWGLTVGTALNGVGVTDNGRTVRFNLTGPDFTVRFVP